MKKDRITRIASVLLLLLFLAPDLMASTRALSLFGKVEEVSHSHRTNAPAVQPSIRKNMTRVSKSQPSAPMASSKKDKAPQPYIGTTFFSNEKTGYLGSHQSDPLNLPKDDIFAIEIKEEPANYAFAYLQYSIKGTLPEGAIGKALNNNEAYVLADAVNAQTWQQLTIEIDKKDIFQGSNNVRFAVNRQQLPLEIKDVQITFSQSPIENLASAVKKGRQPAPLEYFKVDEALQHQAYALDERNMPSIPNHITNVTKGSKGFALQGSSGKSVRVSIAVDPGKSRLFGSGMQEVVLFYFDAESKKWKQVTPEHFDMALNQVEGDVPGNSQYFTGMVKTPEMPEASAFMPTAITDIKAANPAAGMTLIQPPTISQTGEANISYPLSLPQGRAGMTPHLSLNYSSDGGSGMCGFGWTMPMQHISVDQKWGVPTFDPTYQEESYTLNGKSLIIEGGLKPNRGEIDQDQLKPLERADLDADNDGIVHFFERSMSGYKEIKRHGSTPLDYFWTETTADQTTYYYGADEAGTAVEASAVLQNNDGIAKWYLTKVEDKWGNTIHYTYSVQKETAPDNVMLTNGKYVQLEKIEYTGYGSTKGAYSVEFITSTNRLDARLDLGLRIKELDYLTLESIQVDYRDTLIKEYKLNHATGDFHKTLLTGIEEWRSGQKFYEHTFEYEESELTYGPAQEIEVDHTNSGMFGGISEFMSPVGSALSNIYHPSPISTSITTGWGIGGSLGLGIAPIIGDKVTSKDFTFSGHLSGAWSDSKDKTCLADMNGDGLPDLVYNKSSGPIFYPMQKTDDSYSLGFSKKILGRDKLSTSESSTLGYGFSFNLVGNTFFYGQNWNRTNSETTTYTTDYNADGFIDLVEASGSQSLVSFGMPNEAGNFTFASSSKNTYNPIIKNASVTVENTVDEEALKDFEIVRVWIAPFSGTVDISGNAYMIDQAQGEALLMIQLNDDPIGYSYLLNENTAGTFDQSEIEVEQGDLLLFRTRAGEDGQGDNLAWNPQVRYTYSAQDNYLDANGYDYGTSTYQEAFLLSGGSGVTVPGTEAVQVSWPTLSIGGFTDDVTFTIYVSTYATDYTASSTVYETAYTYTLPSGGNTELGLSQFKDENNNTASFLGTLNTISHQEEEDYQVSLRFEVFSTSNVKWQDIDWRPEVGIASVPCVQADKNLYPTVDFYTYNRLLSLNALPESSIFEACGTFLLWPNADFSTAEVLSAFISENQYANAGSNYSKVSYFVVKTREEVLYKLALVLNNDGTYSLHLANADGSYDPFDPLTEADFGLAGECYLPEEAGLYYGFYSPDQQVAEMLASSLSEVIFYDAETQEELEFLEDFENFYHHNNYFQDQIGHWGQFAWSNSQLADILVRDLELSSASVADNNDYSDGSTPTDNDIEALEENLNPIEQQFFMLTPTRGENNKEQLRSYILNGISTSTSYQELDRYSVMGAYMGAYAYQGQTDPGKLGEKEAFIPVTNREEVASEAAYVAYGYPQKSSSYSNAFTGSITPPQSGIQISYGISSTINNATKYKNETLTQFIDINGDGYPDILDGQSDLVVTLTHPSGGHRAPVTYSSTSDMGVASVTESEGASVSGTYINQDGRFTATVGLNGGTNFGNNFTQGEWRDMNGDGLPDYVDHQSGLPYIQLSFGQSLLSSVPAVFASSPTITKPKTINNSYSLGANMGMSSLNPTKTNAAGLVDDAYSTNAVSFSVGTALNTVGSEIENMYLDINGDGLTDRITLVDDTLINAWINTGTSFKLCEECGSASVNDLGRTGNIGLSGSAAGTFSFPLAVYPLLKLKLAISLNGSKNFAINRVLSNFRDVTGDGIPDYVETNSEGNLEIYPAHLEKSNLLRTVHNPLGGSFTIDYERVGNKFGAQPVEIVTHTTKSDEKMIWDMPNSKWVLSSLTINDGYDFSYDGEDTVTYTFRYEGGIKSRRDREFLGFSRIQTRYPADRSLLEELSCTYGMVSRIYTSEVKEYFRPITNTPEQIMQYGFRKGELLKTLSLFHKDSTVLAYYDPTITDGMPDSIPVCTTAFSVALLSETRQTYEHRYVNTDPDDALFHTVKVDSNDDWDVVSWSSIDENATVFPAVTATETITVPVKETPEKVHVLKYDIAYDNRFNVIEYNSGAYEGSPTITENTLFSQTYTTTDVVTRTHYWDDFNDGTAPFDEKFDYYQMPGDAFMNNITLVSTTIDPDTYEKILGYYVVSDGISYYQTLTIPRQQYYLVESLVTGYSDDTVFVPEWKVLEPGCDVSYDTDVEDALYFLTYHTKKTETTVEVIEKVYDVTTYGDVLATLTYFAPTAANSYQTNMLESHLVYLGSETPANLKRKQVVSDIYANKAVGTIQQYYASGTNTDFGETDLVYDAKGNVTSLTGAENLNGQRLTTTFTYDNVVEQFVEGISNSYGDAMCNLYDYSTGLLRRTVDINGQATQYVYDDFYRLKEVWAPLELANIYNYNGPTLSLTYYPEGYSAINLEQSVENKVPVAITYHHINNGNAPADVPSGINPDVTTLDCNWQTLTTVSNFNNALATATFMDGMQRVIQVKKQTSGSDSQGYTSMRQISGMPAYDYMGRNTSTSRDWTEDHAGFIDLGTLNTSVPSTTIQATTFTEEGRTASVTTPITSISYTYKWVSGEAQDENDNLIEAFCTEMGQSFSQGSQLTKRTNRSYVNSLGQQIATVSELDNGYTQATTLFKHNYLGELEEITDPLGQITTYAYDMGGRTIQEVHPDRGTSEYTFDDANNLTKMVLPSTGSTGITMDYNYNRIISKTMPTSGGVNSLSYTYGELSDGFNTAGRVSKIVQGDNFMETSYRYDALGHLVHESKKIQVPQSGVRHFETEFYYDSFGRIKEMEYPDGERLYYTYNLTGDLTEMYTKQVTSAADTLMHPIIDDILYNGRGKIAQIEYGNGTQSTFSYDNTVQRLTNTGLRESNSNTDNLLDKAFAYNAFGEIKSIINSAAGSSVNTLGGAYSMEYEYDGLGRLSNTLSSAVSGFKIGQSGAIPYALNMAYNLAGGITKKTETIGSTSTILDYTYDGTKKHQLSSLHSSTPTNTTPVLQGNYTFNSSGSVEQVLLPQSGSADLEPEAYCRDEEQRLTGAKVDDVYSHYLYDHAGERIMKSALNFHAGGVDGQSSNGNYSLNTYTVYANAYYVANHYNTDVLASKHYYMGTQRVSTGVANGTFTLSEYNLNVNSGGPTSGDILTQSSVTDLDNTLSCLGLVEGTDYELSVLEEPATAEQRMSLQEYQIYQYSDICPPLLDDNSDCYCSIDPYWAVQQGDATSCSDVQVMYWYHPDYLGSTEYVTDANGEAYQFFFRTPWGGDIVQQNSATGIFSSRYGFNAKEKDGETGNIYYGARYYRPDISMWLSVDQRAHWYPTQSPYAFVNNNPINLIDPTGMSSEEPGSLGRFFQRVGNLFSGEGWSTNAQVARQKADAEFERKYREAGNDILMPADVSSTQNNSAETERKPLGSGISLYGSGANGVDNWNSGLNPFTWVDFTDPFWLGFGSYGRFKYNQAANGSDAVDDVGEIIQRGKDIFETVDGMKKETPIANVPKIPTPTVQVDSSETGILNAGGTNGKYRYYRSEKTQEGYIDSAKWIDLN